MTLRSQRRARRPLGALLRLEDRTTPAAAFLLTDNALAAFDTANPAAALAPTPITGLGADTLVGVDVRPQNGVLYGLGVNATADTATLYAIAPGAGTATATAVGGPITLTAADGTTVVDLPDPATAGYGVDFNPAADRVRVVTSTGLNFRVNPNTGAAFDTDTGTNGTQADPNLNDGATPTPAPAAASAAAYTNNTPRGTGTTLYVLDSATDTLFIQGAAAPGPNGGVLSGGLGVTLGGTALDFTAVNGFDIPAGVDAPNSGDPATGLAFAALTVGTETALYTIDVATGAAVRVGTLGDGTGLARGLALQVGTGLPNPGGFPAVALSADGTQLVRFATGPGFPASPAATVTGVDANEVLVGIDYRPATGQLFALGVNAAGVPGGTADTATLYVLDPQTGEATRVGGATGAVAFVGADGTTPVDLPDPATAGYGFDFNPVNGFIRVVTSTGLNFRIDPATGTGVDAQSGAGDPAGAQTDTGLNGGATPTPAAAAASAAAYTNGGGPATATTLYVLDSATDTLYIQGAAAGPNGGVLTPVAPVALTIGGAAVDFTEVNGFDIPAVVGVDTSGAGAAGLGYALLTVGGTTSLYSIDLATGLATALGSVAGLTGGAGLALGAAPGGTVTVTPVAVAVNEAAGTATVTLARTGNLTGPLTVTVAVTGGSATAGNDFGTVPATATFAAGENMATVVIPITQDTETEAAETIELTISAPTGGGVLGADTKATVTIADDEAATVQFTAATATVNEAAGKLDVVVTRTGDTSGAVTVDLAATGVTATDPDDFGPVPTTVSFAAGEVSKTVSIPIVQDALAEPAETFELTLSNAVGGGTGARDKFTVTIEDDEPATLAFGSATTSVAEDAAGGNVVITLTRTGDLTTAADVTVTPTFGTAAAGDFGTIPTTVSFAAGQATATLTVPVTADVDFEGPEDVTFTLSAPTGGAVLGTQKTNTLTVTDAEDDPGAVSFTAATFTVAEAGGSAQVTLTRSGSTGAAVSVTLARTGGTATPTDDFGAVPTTVTIPAGQATVTVNIPVVNDTADEPDETIDLLISAPTTGGATIGAQSMATVTIADDDAPAPVPGQIQFTTAAFPVGEGAGAVSVTLTRTGGTAGAVSVTLAAAGVTATDPDDFGPVPTTVNFADGQANATVIIPIADDAADEPDETFDLTISAPTGGATLGTQKTATVTIADDDEPAPAQTIAFSAAAATVTENGGSITFTLTRTGDTTAAAGVTLARTGGTATPGTDFGTVPTTVNFAAGAKTATVTVNITNDTADEPDETVDLAISAPTGGATLGAQTTFRVTIADDDPAAPAPPADNRVTVGGSNGTVQVYTIGADGKLTPAGTPVTPFPNFTGVVRSTTADVNGDGTPDTIFVTGPGTRVLMTVISGAAGNAVLVPATAPFAGSEDFTGGGFVSAADLNGDGRAEWVVTPDEGGGPRVTIFGLPLPGTTPTVRADFFGIADAAFRGGARSALGDVNKDGIPDLAVAAGFQGGPRVALYSGATLLQPLAAGATAPPKLVPDFFAFPGADAVTLRNGVYVAIGDLTGDGFGELIFGGGPGGAPRVFALNGQLLVNTGVQAAYDAPVANFFVANNSTDRGGVRVATADPDGNGRADLVVGSGQNQPARVRTYLGTSFPAVGEPAGFQDLTPFGGAVLTDGIYVG